jgi:hypothetical protein
MRSRSFIGLRGLRALAASLLLASFGAACGGVQPVSLTNEWPAKPGSYKSVTEAWTRSASMSASYQQVLSVDATLLSPAWRAAQAQRDAELRGLGPAARDALFAKAKADSAGPWQFELLVTNWDRRENDLHRGKRATWNVALLDEQGNEIAPVEIVRDRRPAYMLQAEFPSYGDFAQAYVVSFPKDKPVLGPSVRTVRMRLTSVRGAVELTWNAP